MDCSAAFMVAAASFADWLRTSINWIPGDGFGAGVGFRLKRIVQNGPFSSLLWVVWCVKPMEPMRA
jgi:predicted membrane protein